jgi:hypothetical protein
MADISIWQKTEHFYFALTGPNFKAVHLTLPFIRFLAMTLQGMTVTGGIFSFFHSDAQRANASISSVENALASRSSRRSYFSSHFVHLFLLTLGG